MTDLIRSLMDSLHLKSGRQRTAAIAVAVLLFSAVSIFSTNGYYYGISDHSITVPFLKSSIDPELYPDDYLLAQKAFNYTFFWELLSLLVDATQVPIQVLFFLFYLAALYATFLAVYLVAMVLFGRVDVAFLSMFFFLFSAPTLGGVKTIDPLLNTRLVATPVLLFALYFFLKERYRTSYFLQGISFLIHPLSALYTFVMLFAATIPALRTIGFRRFLGCIGIFTLAAAPVLAWRLLYVPDGAGFFEIDQEWLALMVVRNSDHAFPFWFNGGLFLRAALVLGLFFLSWRRPPSREKHRVVRCATAAVLGMFLLGTLFTELYPTYGVIQLQLFRSFKFLVFLAAIYAANFILAELRENQGFAAQLVAGLIPFGILYRAVEARLAYLGAAALAVALLGHVAVRHKGPGTAYCVSTFVLVALTMLLWNIDGLKLKDVQDRQWRDVQYWARDNTDRRDVFIVPPELSGFRVESERTSYGDWKDGTQMFFDPAFRREWIRRMRNLGYDGDPARLGANYAALPPERFIEIAAEFEGAGRRVYAVVPEGVPDGVPNGDSDGVSDGGGSATPGRFPVAFRNEEYVVRVIAP